MLRNRVREVRTKLGISQRELVRRTGLSRQTLSAIERDNGYSPNGTVMASLGQALDADLGDLFWIDTTEPEQVPA